ncbi:MAG: hypothetical protein J2P41_21565, partial [Blastocatellia bacterium]|nr:hypothetical protein [Blastocatellia bacterium]
YWQPLHEKYGNLSKFVFGPPGDLLQGGKFVLGEPLHNPDYNNFGPQFGFAWSPTRFKSKGVVRGGFGIAYNRVPYSITLNGRLNPPLLGMFTLENQQDILYKFGSEPNSPNGYPSNPSTILQIDPATNIPINLPSTTGKPDAALVTNPDVPNPYTYHYSLDVQYELAGNWLVSLGYQGSTSHKYPRVVNLNYNDWGVVGDPTTFALHNVSYMPTDVNANYNAMLARVSRRFGKGFNFDAQYRWSRSIDTCSDDQSCQQSYPFDQSTERGPSDFDVTHSFVASGLWDLPIFRTRKDVIGKVAGGWQLNGILTASSGFPWTPLFDPGNCGDLNFAGWQCPQRPAAYLSSLSQDTSNSAFMSTGGSLGTSAAQSFVSPTFGTFAPVPGIGRNVFRGPHYFSVDLSTVKRFRLPKFFGENSGLDIRANFLNAFNSLNLRPFDFNTDSTKVNNANFGKALEALSGRVIEFQARFFF